MTAGYSILLALLALEMPLLFAATRGTSRLRRAARVAVFLVPIVVAFGVRFAEAFSTSHVLDWDETYYMSQAITAAHGRGLYPYIYGYGPMRIMGGTGYAVYSQALAVLAGGPNIFSLRAVSLLAGAAGIVGLWRVTREWYGSDAAWITAGVAAASQIFALSNTARMDAWVFAYVSWALAVVAIAWRRAASWRWHFVAGLVCGLGIEVHIDALVTAAACGVVYGWQYLRDAVGSRRPVLVAHPAVAFVLGLSIALTVYVVANILPDPASYYTMTVRIRVDATTMYSQGTQSLLGSFLDPSILMAKEARRYGQLGALMHPLEIALLLTAAIAAAIRRTETDRRMLALIAGVLTFAALLLNNASPLYFIHVAPAVLIPVGPLFSHGIMRRARADVRQVATAALVAATIAICGVAASTAARALRANAARHQVAQAVPPGLADVRARVARHCRLVADAGIYVPYMTDYPRFISLRDTEVHVAMLYYYMDNEAAYWRIKDPDAIFVDGPMRQGLADYVSHSRLRNVAPGLWLDPLGCQ